MQVRSLTITDVSAKAAYESAKALRPDFALVARDVPEHSEFELIGAEWTHDGNDYARYVIVRRDAPDEVRERNVAVLLERCRKSIDANDQSTRKVLDGDERTKERQ